MTRRAIARSWGAPLELVEVESAVPGADHVVIAVRASAVNPADAKLLAGFFGRDPASLPLRPGSEIAGTVTAVGDEVVGLTVGDEVLAYRVVGGFADEVLTSASNVFAKPANLSFEEASGLLLAGATAWHLLEATHVEAGETIIVHGASGAVGLAVLQLAAERGVNVIGTASERNAELVRSYGATPVAYGAGLLERLGALLPDGADAALDTAGTDEAIDTSVALVPDLGRVATINGFARAAEVGALRLGGGPGADPGTTIRNEARAHLVDLAASGVLRVRVGAVYPLERAGEAVTAAASGGAGGKVVIVP